MHVVRRDDGRDIFGTYRTAYIHNWDYHLAEVKIYADGMVDCWGLVDFDGFRQKVQDGWVVTRLPEGATVRVGVLGSFKAVEVWSDVTEEDFVQEVADLIAKFQGRPTSIDRCLVAWERYQAQPDEEHGASLRAAYEAVPTHLRDSILVDQDAKDFPIRAAIYGPDGIPPESAH